MSVQIVWEAVEGQKTVSYHISPPAHRNKCQYVYTGQIEKNFKQIKICLRIWMNQTHRQTPALCCIQDT